MKQDARLTALLILNAVAENNVTLDHAMEKFLDTDSELSRRDRALVSALVYGVMRWRGHIDWIIDHFSRTPLSKMDPVILNILRMGVFQIKFLDRIPDSAAVNTSVQMAKSFAKKWVVGFVNGLLRNVVREADEGFQNVAFPDEARHPAAALSAAKSFPEWLLARWINRFGIEQTRILCDVINTIPPITVRTNTLKTGRRQLFDVLESQTGHIALTAFSAEGIGFDHPGQAIPDTDTFAKGWFQVQDEAAQLIVPFMNPRPGETILDACAGLGGKTGHIGQRMENAGRILALDHDPSKLQRLESEMQRIGVSIVQTMRYNLGKPCDTEFFGTFDRILLDAPCSGLGVLRRNPDSKWSESKKNLQRYSRRQLRFLEHVAPLVKPSGILVYAVCSTEPEENEAVVKKFLDRHAEFVIDHHPGNLTPEAQALIDTSGFLKTFPHQHDMDGFFAVRFKRQENLKYGVSL